MPSEVIVVGKVGATAAYVPVNVDSDGNLQVELGAGTGGAVVDTELPAAALLADGAAIPTTPTVGSVALVRAGATVGMLRTPNVFKYLFKSSTGDTVLWTPAGGKKFRLMRFCAFVPSNSSHASGGIFTLTMKDGATTTNVVVDFYVPAVSVATGLGSWTTGWIDLGNGVLSSAADAVLNANLNAAFAVGGIGIIACGTEE